LKLVVRRRIRGLGGTRPSPETAKRRTPRFYRGPPPIVIEPTSMSDTPIINETREAVKALAPFVRKDPYGPLPTGAKPIDIYWPRFVNPAAPDAGWPA
jgi:hypothetical protein